jgi:hypothetical protein
MYDFVDFPSVLVRGFYTCFPEYLLEMPEIACHFEAPQQSYPVLQFIDFEFRTSFKIEDSQWLSAPT